MARRFELSQKRLELLESMLQAEGVARASTRQVARRPEPALPVPLTFSQSRLWFLEQLTSGSANAAYVIPAALRMRGALDVEVFTRACHELVRRHESLRTVFSAVEGRPLQRVRDDLGADVRVVDLGGTAGEEREREVRRRSDDLFGRPFDLATGPLLRIEVLRLAENESVLLLAMHHIVSDQWSLGVLLRELVSLYAAFGTGRASDLPELAVQYPDFALWQHEALAKDAWQADLEYWARQLRGATAELGLPLVRTRPKEKSYRGASVPVQLPPALVAELRALARKEGKTLFMVLAAALKVLLYRLSGNEDVLLGTPVANRKLAEVEPLIGFFVNTLVLRTDLSGAPTFRELMQRVSKVCLEAYEHQDLPFERLVEELQPERSLSRTPFFHVAFAFQNVPFPAWVAGAIRIEPMQVESGTAKFDLALQLFEEQDHIWGQLEYSLDVFDDATARRIVAYLGRLLRGVVANPGQSIASLPLLDEEEQRELLRQSAGARATREQEWKAGEGIQRRFEQRALETPDAVALRFESQSLTYRELDRRANQLARLLRRHGVGKDVLVGICMERSLELVAGVLAILKAGGAYVPLDPAYPRGRIELVLEDSRVPVLLTQRRLLERLPELSAEVLCVDELAAELEREPADAPAFEVGADDLAYVIYTSGSTGKPKGVRITHRNVTRLLDETAHWFEFGPRDVWTLFHSTAFDFSVWELFGALLYGGRLVVVPFHTSRDPRAFLELLRVEGVTILNQTPSAFYELMDVAGEEGFPATSLRVVIYGGEALNLRKLCAWFEGYGEASPRLVNMYGITETTVHVTYQEITPQLAATAQASLIGEPIPDLAVFVCDDHGQLVPPGVRGEMFVAGRGVSPGYLDRRQLTAERFVDNRLCPSIPGKLYRSGDLARRLPDGRLEYLGRKDSQVKIRGFRIELGEIEAVLATHPQVRGALVTARERVPGDVRLAAYLIADGDPTAGELIAFLKERLPEYMVPAAFVFVPSFPLTSNGKVDRAALPEPDLARPELETAYVAPRDALELAVAEIWSSLLGVERPGVHDDFFELGGHSLLATQVAARLKAALEIELPLRELFERRTVADLAAWLREHGASAEGAGTAVPTVTPRRDRSLPAPLTSPQRRLWFLDQLASGSSAYAIPAALRVYGDLDVALFERACQEVVRRHESLRTVFSSVDGRPEQRVREDLAAELQVVDLRGAAPEGIELELQRRAAGLFRRPFDLTTGPLFRVELLRLTAQESVVLLAVHHIVSDLWSLSVLLRELVGLYAAFSAGRPSPLPELSVQYPDYALWQQEAASQQAWQGHLDYWVRQLRGASSDLGLPLARPRPREKTYRGASVPVALPAALVAELRSLARDEGATLFMLLAAAYKVLLFRLSGNEDIVVGAPVANRRLPEIEPLIGFFVNTLVLRTDLSGAPTFRQLVQRVRDVCLAAYEHQDVPFERLVEELQPERSLARTPLFQVAFTFQNVPFPAWKADSIRLEPMPIDSGTAKFDLELQLFEDGDTVWGQLEYSLDVLDEETVQRMERYFLRLLRGAIASPDEPIAALPLLGADERQALVVLNNATAREWPGEGLIHQCFEHQAHATPEAEALRFEGQRLTYGELDRRANQLAHRLRRLGVGRDVLVGISMERSLEMVVSLIATLKAGGAYVPLDPGYPTARLAFMLEDSRVPVLLTQRRILGSLPEISAEVLCLDELEDDLAREPSHAPDVEIGGEDLAYVIYTSGSTGKPKGVMNVHAGIRNRLLWMRDEHPLSPADRVLQKTPFSFDISVWEFFWPLMNGACLVVSRPGGHKDSRYLIETIREQGITAMHFVPSMLQVFLQESGVEECRSLKRVFCSGEALPRELQERFFARSEAELHNLYGPTEAAVEVTAWTCRRDGDPRPVPIGYPIANTQMYVLDGLLQPVPPGVAGELHIGGRNLARGYLNRADLTAEKFIQHPFDSTLGARVYRTGDLARYRDDGAIEFLGRLDYQVKLRGFRIELGEIEQVLAGDPEVAAAVVTARELREGDTRLVAYVTGEAEPKAADLVAYLKERLPEYMVPSAFVYLPAFPLTPNGKVDRKALPEPEFGRAELDTPYVAPRDAVERSIAEVWSELLGTERVGIHDSFFALGGHSLLATQAASRLKSVLGIDLPLREVFERPTVAELAAWLVEHGALGSQVAPLPVADRTQDLPLSFAQEWLCVHHPVAAEDPFHNVVTGVRITGRLDEEALERSLTGVVGRHEALRTRVVGGRSGPLQVVDAEGAWPLTRDDLRALEPGARQQELRRLIDEESRRQFRLAEGPLVRGRLVRLAAEESVLLLVMHHAVTDNWSFGVLVRELTQRYEAQAEGRQPALPALRVQYPDFAVWQRQQLASGALEEGLAYWRARLKDLPAAPRFEAAGLREAEAVTGAVHPFVLDRRLTAAIHALARREGATPFMVLMAAYDVLLSSFSGSDDVSVSFPSAGRYRRETEELIGYFVNTLLVRTDLSGSPSFRELVGRVRQSTLAATTHQEVPLRALRDDLAPGRDPFRIAFNLLNAPLPPLELPGMKLEPLDFESGYVFSYVLPGLEPAEVDLALVMREDGEELRGMWLRAAERVEAQVMGRMMRRWGRVLELVTGDPDQTVEELRRGLCQDGNRGEA